VLDERITADYARAIYGVVLRGTAQIVDPARTAALRRKLAARPGKPARHLAYFHASLARLLGAPLRQARQRRKRR
jgi:hypothetical protein